MNIRQPRPTDGEALLTLMKTLDSETKFMMLEPGERTTTVEEQTSIIEGFLKSNSRVMWVADDGDGLTGFVVGVGNMAARNQHCMSCVIGILQKAVGQRLGARLMTQLEDWARGHGFTRIELTVMAHNDRARRLYLGQGFEVEGTKRQSLLIDGEYIDELYMAKLLNA